MSKHKQKIARFENKFVFHARYKLSSREQKVVLHLVSRLNPKVQKDFHKIVVSIKELESVIMKGERSGSLYKEIIPFYTKLSTQQIHFPSDITLNGEQMPGIINWFQHVMPKKTEEGLEALEFAFAEALKPALLQLKHYVRLPYSEIISMRSGHAIHLYQILKAKRDEKRQYEKVTKVVFSVNELKSLLDVIDSYNGRRGFGDFNRKVVQPAVDEINACSEIISIIKYEKIRVGRKVANLSFSIIDTSTKESTPKIRTPKLEVPKHAAGKKVTSKEIKKLYQQLSFAQEKAYKLLMDFGMLPHTILKDLIPSIKGGEVEGFEDFYAKKVLAHFKKKAKAPTPDVLFTWWVKKGIYNEGDEWTKLIEAVAKEKKKLETKQSEAFYNRLESRTKTAVEFRDWYARVQDAKEKD